MKRLLFAFCLLCMGTMMMHAQKFAVINMEYILEKLPAYQQATSKIEAKTKEWQKEVERLGQQAKALYEQYQATNAQLTDAQRTVREQEIVDTEKKAAELKRNYFGPKGELMKMRESLIKPIQDKVYSVVKQLSEANDIYAVFEKSAASGLFYSSEQLDISDAVLKTLGY